jgi:hypothetical protein
MPLDQGVVRISRGRLLTVQYSPGLFVSVALGGAVGPWSSQRNRGRNDNKIKKKKKRREEK